MTVTRPVMTDKAMKGQSMKKSIMCHPAILTTAVMGGGEAADTNIIKSRQQAMWASGDFAVIGTTLQIVGEELCEAMDLRSGQRVLDVAAGNGNAALAAARRWCDVTASDYVPALLDRARERALAERLPLKIEIADAEALPFPGRGHGVSDPLPRIVLMNRVTQFFLQNLGEVH